MASDPTVPQRVAAAMAEIEQACRANGVKIITRLMIEKTSMGDRAILDTEWAVAALREWPPEGEETDPEVAAQKLTALNTLRKGAGMTPLERLP